MKLNKEEQALVVVEGIKDARALRDAGFVGKIFMLCQKQNVNTLEKTAANFRKAILLLDNDSEGQKLSRRTQKILSGRVRFDLFYQKEIFPASRGKIRRIEDLGIYSQYIVGRIRALGQLRKTIAHDYD